jgi:hypothetical protein
MIRAWVVQTWDDTGAQPFRGQAGICDWSLFRLLLKSARSGFSRVRFFIRVDKADKGLALDIGPHAGAFIQDRARRD